MQPFDPVPAHDSFDGGRAGQIYNEAAFRHFLAVDRSRAERFARTFLLVLVTIRQHAGAPLPPPTSAALFRGLGESIRDVDFAGWFRQGRVAGAVLAQDVITSESAQSVVAQRIGDALQKQLPADLAPWVRVRVIRLGSRPTI